MSPGISEYKGIFANIAYVFLMISLRLFYHKQSCNNIM